LWLNTIIRSHNNDTDISYSSSSSSHCTKRLSYKRIRNGNVIPHTQWSTCNKRTETWTTHTHTHTHTQIPHGLAYPEKYRLEGLHQLVQELGMPQSLVLYHQLQMPPPLMEFSLDQQFIEHCNFYHYVQNKLKASISLNH
jgi:hypothetical protein